MKGSRIEWLKKICLGVIGLLVLGMFFIAAASFISRDFIDTYGFFLAFFYMLPLMLIMILLLVVISKLDRAYVKHSLLSRQAIIKRVLGEKSYVDIDYKFPLDILMDPAIKQRFANAFKQKQTIRGVFNAVPFTCAHLVSIVKKKGIDESERHSNRFEGTYLFLPSVNYMPQQHDPILVCSNHYWDKYSLTKVKKVVVNKQRLIEIEQKSNLYKVMSNNPSEAALVLSPQMEQRLMEVAQTLPYEFTVFLYGNGAIGVSIQCMSLFDPREKGPIGLLKFVEEEQMDQIVQNNAIQILSLLRALT